jgi:hypothetical protein
MSVNSMNNRFMPRPEITTECVVNMDDDAFSKSLNVLNLQCL